MNYGCRIYCILADLGIIEQLNCVMLVSFPIISSIVLSCISGSSSGRGTVIGNGYLGITCAYL